MARSLESHRHDIRIRARELQDDFPALAQTKGSGAGLDPEIGFSGFEFSHLLRQ